jgi:hypothetical protein
MRTRVVVGLAGFALTVVLTIPALFLLSRDTVSTNQFVLIVSGVLLLVLWTITYAALVDPWLRRVVGGLFGVTIEWRGTTNSLSWTPAEKIGCVRGLVIDGLGYFFIFLWLLPFAAATTLILWFRR